MDWPNSLCVQIGPVTLSWMARMFLFFGVGKVSFMWLSPVLRKEKKKARAPSSICLFHMLLPQNSPVPQGCTLGYPVLTLHVGSVGEPMWQTEEAGEHLPQGAARGHLSEEVVSCPWH